MPDRRITHADFTLERDFRVSPARVFAAFSDADLKRVWFAARGERVETRDAGQAQYELDFRIGGHELTRVRAADGRVYTSKAVYYDIVPGERIVYTYETYQDETRISVSLVTVEFLPEDGGTLVILTESGAYLDGFDKPKSRREGADRILDELELVLHRP